MNSDVETLRSLRKEWGTSRYDFAVKKLNRERLDGADNRPKRKPLSASKRNALYAKQGGLCPICQEMFHIRDMTDDHFDAHAGEKYNDFRNRRLVCKSCNSTKNANTIIEEAKRLGVTVTRMVEDQNELHNENIQGME